MVGKPSDLYAIKTKAARGLQVGDALLMEGYEGEVLASDWNMETRKVAVLLAPSYRTAFLSESSMVEVWEPKEGAR